MVFFSVIGTNLKAQIIDFVKPTTTRLSYPRLVRPLVSDCNGHGINPGVRDILGGTASGLNRFRTATEWINGHSGSNTISGNLALEGSFLIDQPVVFQGADVRASSNAKITVVTSMESNGSKFYACEGLWEGIVAGGTVNGRVSLTGGTVIEDAKVGVLFSSSSRAAIVTGTTFKRNVIGIGYKGIGKPSFRFTEFNGNTFECKKPINFDPLFDYEWSTSGITIVGGKLDIIGTNNLFTSKIRVGIEVLNATSTIKGCKMDSVNYAIYPFGINILTGEDIGGDYDGYGITAKNSNINIENCQFIRCAGGGVRSEKSSIAIAYSYFDFEVVAALASLYQNLCISLFLSKDVIHCNQNENKTINIHDNTIILGKKDGIAIYLEKSNKTMYVANNNFILLHNTIFMGHDNSLLGIYIKGKGSGSKERNCTISDNIFEWNSKNGTGHATPIFLDKTAFVDVVYNIVHRQAIGHPTINTASFFVSGSSNCDFFKNEVNNDRTWNPNVTASLDNTTAFYFKGTAEEPCRENIIHSNTVDRIDHAFVFEGDCNHSVFTCNTMKDCITRLYLIKPKSTILEPKIGEQLFLNLVGFQDNYENTPTFPVPIPSSFVNDAVHEGKAPSLSQFFVQQPDYPHNPQVVKVQPGLKKNDWFESGSPFNEFSCETQKAAVSTSLSAADEAIIAEEFVEDAAVWNWENKIALYNRLFENPDLRVGEASTFFDNLSTTPLATYAAALRKVNHFFDLSEELKEQVNTLYAQRESKKRELDALVNNATANYGQNWSEETTEIVADAFEEFNTIEKALFTLSDVVKQERISKAQSLKIEIAALSGNAVYQQDFKTLYTVILSAYLNEKTVNAIQMAQLQAIAAKCPKVSGTNVFAAVSLLSPQGMATYDGTAACEGGQIPASGKQQHTNVSLYPNPSNESMVLNVASISTLRNIEIWDIQGRSITSLALPAYQEQLNIATTELIDGIYMLKVANSDGAIQTEKFVVKH
jgi:hypothetical protein